MGKMNKLIRKTSSEWSIVCVGTIYLITLIFLLINGENIYIQVHDNLDSQIALYKMLKESGLYWSIGTTVPVLGGIDRNYLFSDLKVYTWLHMIFPTFIAIIVSWYLKITISILSFVLLGKTIYGKGGNKNIFIMCGLIYGLCPTYPAAPFGFASLPLLLSFLLLLYKKNDWKYMLFFLLYPLLSDFSYFGLFICGFILLFFIIDWIVKRRPLVRFLYALGLLAIGYIITEWRLFYVMLFSNQESIRAAFSTDYANLAKAFRSFASAFAKGHYHSGSAHFWIVLPICLGYFIFLNYSYLKNKNIKGIIQDCFNWIMVWQIFNCLIYSFDQMKWFNMLKKTILPVLQGVQFSRTLWFSPFLWYFALMIILCRVSWKKKYIVLVCFLALLSVCFYPEKYNHIYWNSLNTMIHFCGEECTAKLGETETDLLSYSEFYSEDLFNRIKKDIDYSGEWAIAYGMHPSILYYNGVATLDGYVSNYSEEYKELFRDLIEPDLLIDVSNAEYFDEWGGRAYIFSKELPYAPVRSLDISSAELLINPDVFERMGGKYVFSRVEVENAKDLGLSLIDSYSDEKSPYTIWLYKKGL